MYEIKQQNAYSFITDRSISLPRFQRKQTWDDIKNFQLCISVFKGYPLGVCILNKERVKTGTKNFLLDGRQRRNALTQMYENPEAIGIWAKKFLKFKTSIDSIELKDLFYEKVNEYLENDDEYIDESSESLNEDEELLGDEEFDEDVISFGENGLDLLCEIVLLTYKKSKHATGFTVPFDFVKYINQLPYVDLDEKNNYKLNGKKLKSFIDEYRTDCENNDKDYKEDWQDFSEYLISRGSLQDKKIIKKVKDAVEKKWSDIVARFNLIEYLDAIMRNCELGLIVVNGFKPADSQKIFNIINSEGVKLTAVEILSAKTYWNNKINNPSAEMLCKAQELYSNMNIKIDDVYRWDIPATLLSRLNNNVIFKDLSWDSKNKKTEFEKKLTLGFKLFAGIYQKGIKKEDIDNMGKNASIDWNINSETTISELKSVICLVEDNPYFKFLKSWRTTIMELTSDAIALDYILIMYFDWIRKNKPFGASTKTKQFQKNSIILWDQLIYEYVRKQWRGSSDSMIATNIKNIDMDNEDEVFSPIGRDRWEQLIDEIYNDSKINDTDVSVALMKPILYHMYCLNEIAGPGIECTSIDVDHIIPQSNFKSSTIPNKEVVQDNLFNLALLPKKDNISKSNKELNIINDTWLINQIKTYEFIEKDKFDEFSNVANYKELFRYRRSKFDEAFGDKRDNLLI